MVMTVTVNMSLALCVHAEVMAGEFPDGNDSDSEHVIGSVCSC